MQRVLILLFMLLLRLSDNKTSDLSRFLRIADSLMQLEASIIAKRPLEKACRYAS